MNDPNPGETYRSRSTVLAGIVGFILMLAVIAVAWLDFSEERSSPDLRVDYGGPVPQRAQARFGRSAVNILALSPSGDLLAVGTEVGLNLYQTESMEDAWSLPSIWPVLVLAWSPDGQLLAAGLEDGTVVIVDPSEGEVLNLLTNEGDREVHSLAWSQTPTRPLEKFLLAVGYLDGTLLLSSVDMGDVSGGTALEGQFPNDIAGISALAFSPNDRILASGNRAGIIHLWDAEALAWIGSLEAHEADHAVLDLAWSSQGDQLLSGGWDGKVIRWDVVTFSPLQIHEELASGVLALGGFGAGPSYAAAAADGTLIGWPSDRAEPAYRFPELLDHSASASWSADGQVFAAVDRHGVIGLWDFMAGQTSRLPSRRLIGHGPHGAWTAAVQISPDGSLAASGLGDQVRIWDTRTMQLVWTLEGHESLVTSLTWSPDGAQLASGSRDRTIRIWDIDSGELVQTLMGHSRLVSDLDWSPDGQQIASTGSLDNQVILWEVGSGEILQTISGPDQGVWSVAWSPDANILAYGTASGDVMLSELQDSSVVQLRGHLNWVSSLDWAPDGSVLASAAADGRIILWDVAQSAALAPLIGHRDVISGVAFSPDGVRLASASQDKLVMIWEVDDRARLGDLPMILEGHTGGVTDLSWRSQGDLLASGSRDGTVVLWDAEGPPPE